MEDPKQSAVISAGASERLLVSAGPGTGKTEVAARRIVSLLGSGLGPAELIVLSFSRSAVRTLILRLERVGSCSGAVAEELRHVAVRTFDSWAFRMLRRIGHAPRELFTRGYEGNIGLLVEELRGVRRADLRLLLSGVRHILVDEYQDLSGARGALVLELLDLLAPPRSEGAGFTILGDEAQAIYGFSLSAGANGFAGFSAAHLFSELRSRYGSELRHVALEKNYRSATNLASLARNLRNILTRDIPGEEKLAAMRKILSAVPELKGPVAVENLICGAGDGSAAVLTRTNGEALRVAQLLVGKEESALPVPVVLRTGSQTPTMPAWVGVMLGPMQGVTLTRSQFSRIYAHLFAGERASRATALRVPTEAVAWQRLCFASGVAADSSSIDLKSLRSRIGWPDLFPDDEGDPGAVLQVMTIHQSKGMEFDAVSVLEPEERDAPPLQASSSRADDTDEDDAAEGTAEDANAGEASVIFVAVTRAGKIVQRIPSGIGYSPLRQRRFGSRVRWCSWRNGWVNLETGLAGDINAESFVSTRLHGDTETVRAVQEFLAEGVCGLRGRKVMLCRREVTPGMRRFVYGIHLQEGDEPGRLIGSTSQQMTDDLLTLLWRKGYGLPSRIYNLRITDIVTLGSADPSSEVSEDFNRSGLWLGVQIYGTADFRPPRRMAARR